VRVLERVLFDRIRVRYLPFLRIQIRLVSRLFLFCHEILDEDRQQSTEAIFIVPILSLILFRNIGGTSRYDIIYLIKIVTIRRGSEQRRRENDKTWHRLLFVLLRNENEKYYAVPYRCGKLCFHIGTGTYYAWQGCGSEFADQGGSG